MIKIFGENLDTLFKLAEVEHAIQDAEGAADIIVEKWQVYPKCR